MRDEYLTLLRNKDGLWCPYHLTEEPFGCKWVLKIKENLGGTTDSYKALLIAKGFHQVPCFDFKETFSLVVNYHNQNYLDHSPV